MVRGQYAECMKIKPSYEQNNHSENRHVLKTDALLAKS